MIQRYKGHDAIGEKLVYDIIIKIYTLLIYLSVTIGNDSRPGNRETVNLKSHFLHKSNVFFPMMIEITCHLAVSLFIGTFKGIEVGNGHAFSVLIPSAFNLESRRSCSPEEIFGKRVIHWFVPHFLM